MQRSLYLLTIWQERPSSHKGPAIWRFGLENARTGERRSFGDLESFIRFLQQWLAREDCGQSF